MSKELVTTSTAMPVQMIFFDANQFETMQRVCSMFASSDLVPDNYRAQLKPIPAGASEPVIAQIKEENQQAKMKAIANCMIAVEISSRIGASPLMIMQNMSVIYGKPSWSSKFLIATVNTCGRFEPLKFRFIDKGALGMVDYTDYVWDAVARTKKPVTKQFDGKNIQNLECIAYTTQKGSEDILESAPVSIQLAVQEGWYTKNGSKWQTMTRQMLMYRAASMWTNVYAPEIQMGMSTIEEEEDIADTKWEEVPLKKVEEPLPNSTVVDFKKVQTEGTEKETSKEDKSSNPGF